LENLSNDVWKTIAKYGDSTLELKFKGPNDKHELYNLVGKLKAKADKSNFNHVSKAKIVAALASLLGVDGQSPEWRYLNGGTHEEEDREEFDWSTVEKIITSLESLDAVLKSGSK